MSILRNRLWEHLCAYQGTTGERVTVARLSEVAGVSRPTLLRYLNNTTRNYDPVVIMRMSAFLRFPVETFFTVAEEASPESKQA